VSRSDVDGGHTFRWRPAEFGVILPSIEGFHAGQRKVRQALAVVDEIGDALQIDGISTVHRVIAGHIHAQ